MPEAIHINVRFQAKPGKQAELARRMVELGPDVEALGGTSIVAVDSDDETVLLTVHGTDFRIERSSPVAA